VGYDTLTLQFAPGSVSNQPKSYLGTLTSGPMQGNSAEWSFDLASPGKLLFNVTQRGSGGGAHAVYLDNVEIMELRVGWGYPGAPMAPVWSSIEVPAGHHTVRLAHIDDYWSDNLGTRETKVYLATTPPATVTIRGTVYDDAYGTVLQGVDVAANDRQAQTDFDGKYEITGLSPGQITIIASKSGFLPQSKNVTAQAGLTLTIDDFRLLLEGAIVIDSGFRPSKNGFHFKNESSIPVFPPEHPKRVVGYYPEYGISRMPIANIQYDKLTTIIYFSISPLANGDLDVSNIDLNHQDEMVNQAHANGVDVFICVGGWDRSAHFSEMASAPTSRANFVAKLTQYCIDNNLNGADLDWEPVGEPNKDYYSQLVKDLRDSFTPHHLKLTVAVTADGQEIRPWAIQYVDWLNIMAYDMGYPHSTLDGAIQALNNWENYGFPFYGTPRAKEVLGVPFYGKTANNDVNTYAEIMSKFHPQPEDDKVNGFSFNGINTIKDKTKYSFGYGGIMIWELSQDTLGSTSLLNAIDETVRQSDRVTLTGYCIGMSLAALNYYRLGITPILNTNWPAPNNPQMQYIYKLQNEMHQYESGALGFFGLISEQLYLGHFLESQCETVRNTITSGVPCPVGLCVGGIDLRSHMVLAYKIIEAPVPGGKDYLIYVYDSVYPNDDKKYIQIRCANGVWSMFQYGGMYWRLVKAIGSLTNVEYDLDWAYTLHSPATIRAIDPDGLVIDPNHSEVDGGYYRLLDIDGDGHEEQVAFVLTPKEGQYSVAVIPDSNAEPNATYTLEEQKFGKTTVLAQDVPISEIPSEPYKSVVVLPTPSCEQAVELLNYELVTQKRLSRTEFEYTFRLRVANSWIRDLKDVTVRLVAEPNNTTVLDDTVHFATIHAWTEAISDDTFTIRTDRTIEGSPTDVVWQICDCKMKQRADFNNDWSVDFHDFSALAEAWLRVGDNMPEDVYPDGKIDVMDLMIFSEEWLK
jgi:GH18 family chitinase